MSITFQSSVLFVSDMTRSLSFYQELLGQTVKVNYQNINIGFDGFALWEKNYASTQVWGSPEMEGRNRAFELYFETPNISELSALLMQQKVKFLQTIHEAPWGQLSLRIEDPDGNAVEIGEPLATMVKRMLLAGMSHQEIMQKSGMSLQEIEAMLIV